MNECKQEKTLENLSLRCIEEIIIITVHYDKKRDN